MEVGSIRNGRDQQTNEDENLSETQSVHSTKNAKSNRSCLRNKSDKEEIMDFLKQKDEENIKRNEENIKRMEMMSTEINSLKTCLFEVSTNKDGNKLSSTMSEYLKTLTREQSAKESLTEPAQSNKDQEINNSQTSQRPQEETNVEIEEKTDNTEQQSKRIKN